MFRYLADLWHALSLPQYQPLVEVRVSAGALRHNFHAVGRAVAPCAVAPVLKANAYGHGLRQVADALRDEPAPFWCVDSYYEAWLLRRWGFRVPLLVMGFTADATMAANRLRDVHFSIGAPVIDGRARRPQEVQLKIETGMHRQGVAPDDVVAAIASLHAAGYRVTGAFSHLADADTVDSMITVRQIAVWNAVIAQVRVAAPEACWFHLAASAGTAQLAAMDANVVRLGLGLYGIDPYPRRDLGLRPSLALVTKIASLRMVPAGESVGYNATWAATSPRHVATIPVGYFEGLDRRLSNLGTVTVRGAQCPVVGRVSMNMATVDVTDVPDAAVGDEAVVFSSDPTAANAVARAADLAHTIPYELLVHIPSHLRRVLGK
jgi:alanine racemase